MVKFLDIGYVLKVVPLKSGHYVYIVEGKNDVYRVYSKRYFEIDSLVYIYSDGTRYMISDR